MSEILNRPLLDFYLHDWLGLNILLAREPFSDHTPETIAAMLDTAAKLAASHFQPHFKKSDQQEPYQTPEGAQILPEVATAIKAYAEAGFTAAPFAPAHGGLGLPNLVHTAASAFFMGANAATAAYSMLTIGNAGVIAAFGTPAQIETFLPPALDGSWTGTMCLSEPQAGSSLGDITTRAIPDGKTPLGERFRLFGNKMWISGGDHNAAANITHLVLAKIPGDDGALTPGPKGISLFIVPKFLPNGPRNDVSLAGLNHKMGYRGTTNCLLNFGEGAHCPENAPGAIGWLIGAPGQGLAVMFHMMNEARIGVGLGAAMMGYRGYRLALDYARTRPQGRALSARNPASPQIPIIEHADVKRMLLACKSYSEGALALILYCAKLVDDAHTAPTPALREQAEAMLGLLTPVAKTWPSEYGLAANDLAIQIHGGYGYTRDYDVEQLYRDNRLNPIHEGTTGIQAQDLLGRKILRDKATQLTRFALRVQNTISAAPADFTAEAQALQTILGNFQQTLQILENSDNEEAALCNATNFLSAFGHFVVGALWLDIVAHLDPSSHQDNFIAGQKAAARYFLNFEIPKIAAWLAPLNAANQLTLTMRDEWFF